MSYQRITDQLNMALDEVRNKAYQAALKHVITTDSIVLDVGAGLGPFGLFAAQLGAKKVYCVEPHPLVHTINNVARDNGLEGRIHCLQGRIEEVELPEQVDVITSCFTGNFLLGENLLPSLYYARDHYLKPNGTMLPHRASMIAAPVSTPVIHKRNIARLSEPHLGIKYHYYRHIVANQIGPNKHISSQQCLAEPKVLQTLDFYTDTQAACDQNVVFEINQEKTCHGILGWFDMALGTQILSTGPSAPDVHWSPLLLPIDPPLTVKKGDQLSVTIKKNNKIDWSWIVKNGNEKRHQSAALANPFKLKPALKSPLTAHSEQLLFVLRHFKLHQTDAEISKKLQQQWPRQLTQQGAQALVQQLRKEHCKP